MSCRSPSPRRGPDGRIMEWGYGCIQARDEIMVKAWCAWSGWCACDAALTVSYCGLLYTTRRWLGGLVDRLGSWTDFNFQDGQDTGSTGRLAGMTDEWLPCYGCGDGADRACAVSRSAGAPKNHPTRRRQPTRGAFGPRQPWEAPARESRHRVTVCPFCPPVPCPVFAVQPVTPFLLAGTPGRKETGFRERQT